MSVERKKKQNQKNNFKFQFATTINVFTYSAGWMQVSNLMSYNKKQCNVVLIRVSSGILPGRTTNLTFKVKWKFTIKHICLQRTDTTKIRHFD